MEYKLPSLHALLLRKGITGMFEAQKYYGAVSPGESTAVPAWAFMSLVP